MNDAATPLVIAGAGIGGLSAALFLARNGIESVVVERRTAFGEAGAGIQLSPNASRPLIAAGLGPALMRSASASSRILLKHLASGRTVAEVPLKDTQERHGAPYWTIRRADLHEVLLDAVRALPQVRLLVGRELEQWDEASATAGLRLSGGKLQTLSAAGLIGADGVGSRVRALLGDARKPVFRGTEAWRAVIPARELPPHLSQHQTVAYLGAHMHVVHYPVAGGEAVNLVAVLPADAPRLGYGNPGDAASILAQLAGASPDVAALVAAATDWRVWSLHDLPVRRMARGRVALLGDAAHPILPYLAQGGAMAIEDAATLAECIAAEPAMETALGRYDSLRRSRVAAVQDAARQAGRIYHLRAPFAQARDVALAALGPERLARRYDWVYRWRSAAAL